MARKKAKQVPRDRILLKKVGYARARETLVVSRMSLWARVLLAWTAHREGRTVPKQLDKILLEWAGAHGINPENMQNEWDDVAVDVEEDVMSKPPPAEPKEGQRKSKVY